MVEVPAASGARRSAVLTEPTLLFIVVAGMVHIARGYAADIVLFFGMAALLVWDARRSPALGAVPRPLEAGRWARAVIVLSSLGFGVLVSRLPRDAPELNIAFAAPGLAVLWALVGRPLPGADTGANAPAAPLAPEDRKPPPLARTGAPRERVKGQHVLADGTIPGRAWLAWPVVGLLLGFVELGSFLSQPDARTDNPSHPTVSTVVEPWLDNQAARAAVLAVWLVMGWWLFRRLSTWAAQR